jgi:hypothetical protein
MSIRLGVMDSSNLISHIQEYALLVTLTLHHDEAYPDNLGNVTDTRVQMRDWALLNLGMISL